MKRLTSYCLFNLLLIFLSHSHASAGIRPSFNLETCSWNATDIVVATEGKKIDGVFRVLESWKGDLNPGDTIKLPAMASFQPESARAVSDLWFKEEKNPQLVVTGERMVLFLKREFSEPASESENATPLSATSIKWKPASFFREMNVSVVWIERGEAFGFVQIINPGPSLLVPLGSSEDELKNRAHEIQNIRISFFQAASITDPSRRAEALAPFVHHSLYHVQEAALEALKRVGPAALPVLRRLVTDDSLSHNNWSLVEVMAEAGKNEAGPDLVGLIERDLEFWKRTGPLLQKGWWNAEGFGALEEVEPLRARYMRDHEALQALTKRPYQGSDRLLTELRDFWRSLPQLEQVGLDQISKACDEALAELDRLKANRDAIRFEGLRTFGESDLLKSLREQGIRSDGSSPFTPDLVHKAKLAIQQHLASRGHTHATVVAEIDAPSRSLTFVIDEGERVGIAEIRFEGNKVFSSNQLGGQMKQCVGDYGDDGYNAEIVESCLQRLNHFVRSKGYLQANLHHPETKETKDGLVLTIHADEGILYRLGEMTIQGARFLSADQIRTTIGLQKGDIANGEKIGKALFEVLKKHYSRHGFIQYTAEVDPTFRNNPRNHGEGIVDFEVVVDEGKQFKLRSIAFSGSDLPRKQLLSMLAIREGDIFDQQLYEESIEKLNESDLFDPIDKDRDADFKTDEEQGLIDIVIKLNKAHRERNPAEATLIRRLLEPSQ